MIKTNFKTSGYILFVSMALTLATTLIISSFMASIPSETLRINMRIAKTKALYNAETGVAQKAYPFMIRSEFTADTTLTGELIQNFSSNYNHDVDMGLYLGPKLSFSDSGERQATVEGVSFIINANGVLDSVKQSVSISARPETLAKYMYLTESEKAGGAPMSFGGPGSAGSDGVSERRYVYFGPNDALEGIVQSNSLVSMSPAAGCPDFSDAQFNITRPGPDPSLTCSYQELFQTNNPDDIDTVSTPAVKLPPTGYETLKNNATIFYDSGRKIYNQFGTKDTLIMTEVEFFESGRMNLKQWWYLVPPHLDEDVTNPEDQISSFPRHLDGIDNGDIEFKKLDNKIELKDVSFSYVDNFNVLNNVDLTIHAGQTTAIVGSTGSGKSTLIKLLLRLYEINNGSISYDSNSLKDIELSSLREKIGLVSQDVFLFEGTVIENIAYGDLNASESEVWNAAQKSEADEFINNLPQKEKTIVGERGQKLSGGQRQRISIARAILKNPEILILDEATSSVDNETEAAIQRSLDILKKDRTVIVIAHRLSTVRNADIIYVLENGSVVESGNHASLLDIEGVYSKLWSVQTGEKI